MKELPEASPSLTSGSIIRATEEKNSLVLHKNREVDQWNGIEDLDINPHTDEHLILSKKLKLYNGKKKSSSTNGAGITGCRHVEE